MPEHYQLSLVTTLPTVRETSELSRMLCHALPFARSFIIIAAIAMAVSANCDPLASDATTFHDLPATDQPIKSLVPRMFKKSDADPPPRLRRTAVREHFRRGELRVREVSTTILDSSGAVEAAFGTIMVFAAGIQIAEFDDDLRLAWLRSPLPCWIDNRAGSSDVWICIPDLDYFEILIKDIEFQRLLQLPDSSTSEYRDLKAETMRSAKDATLAWKTRAGGLSVP